MMMSVCGSNKPESEIHLLFVWDIRGLRVVSVLDLYCAVQSVYRATKLCEKIITGEVHQTAMMGNDSDSNRILMRGEHFNGRLLIGGHESAVADHIAAQHS